ncbi:MAG: TetR family transcriptional regulator [Lachnospiraceae bacterium]|jgi:AcrR family transcriptional regulator|nr:TetR family transcriptional regulator [Lachnospiraceae bacterium]
MDANQPTAKERLLQTGLRLFSRHGYDATSTRMIAADAHVNLNMIQFHFGGKENFYRGVLEYASGALKDAYGGVYEEIQAAKAKGALDAEAAWGFISRLIDIQLHAVIDQPDPERLSLMYWEQRTGVADCTPMSDVAQTMCEATLASLIVAYRPGVDEHTAAVLSRFINGGIVSFGEHPEFSRLLNGRISDNVTGRIKEALKPFIMSSIEGYSRGDGNLLGDG